MLYSEANPNINLCSYLILPMVKLNNDEFNDFKLSKKKL